MVIKKKSIKRHTTKKQPVLKTKGLNNIKTVNSTFVNSSNISKDNDTVSVLELKNVSILNTPELNKTGKYVNKKAVEKESEIIVDKNSQGLQTNIPIQDNLPNPDRFSEHSYVNNPVTNPLQSERISEKFLLFAAWYTATGDSQVAYEKSNYDIKISISELVDKYRSYNMPQPPDPQARRELLGIITDKLSKGQLADIIVNSARDGKDNKIANMLLELYLQQERAQTIDEYRAAEIDQRFRWAIENPDILTVITTLLNLQAAPDITASLPYWREQGRIQGKEKLEGYKSLIEQALSSLQNDVYVDKRQLAAEVAFVDQAQPIKRKAGRPRKAGV